MISICLIRSMAVFPPDKKPNVERFENLYLFISNLQAYNKILQIHCQKNNWKNLRKHIVWCIIWGKTHSAKSIQVSYDKIYWPKEKSEPKLSGLRLIKRLEHQKLFAGWSWKICASRDWSCKHVPINKKIVD